jgi:hypothetical protein
VGSIPAPAIQNNLAIEELKNIEKQVAAWCAKRQAKPALNRVR